MSHDDSFDLPTAETSSIASRAARIEMGDTPYPLFVYAGLLPWMFATPSVSMEYPRSLSAVVADGQCDFFALAFSS
ncbi:MAG: hypothetical protein ABI614_01475 [Planctomycetota bacterium]